MMSRFITVTADNGVHFNVVFAGTTVEFWDARFNFGDYGQFVSRYSVNTILGLDQWGSKTGGLDLMGHEPDWKIDAQAMAVVRAWLGDKVTLADPPTHACANLGCGALIYDLDGTWVDATSGDHGGTYDICTASEGGHKPGARVRLIDGNDHEPCYHDEARAARDRYIADRKKES